MNSFDEHFFKQFVPEGQKIKSVIHKHIIIILDKLIIYLFFGVFVTSLFYYQSERVREYIDFIYFEGFLILLFIKIIYDIFDWYNDVWIVTDDGVVDLDWSLFSTDTISVRFENIEGIGVEQIGIMDTILNKGHIIIEKIGADKFVLEDTHIPYDSVNEIERISKEYREMEAMRHRNEFDMIMDALSNVVREELAGVKERRNLEEDEKEIEYIKEEPGTIDLR